MATAKATASKISPPKNQALVDSHERALLQTALNTNIFVEAGAGSGKTYALVSRILALIADSEVDKRLIVAVTFTRKAAIELRERLQLALEGSLRDSTLEAHHPQYRAALADSERVFVGTIHQFCTRLLRSRPIEAGIDPAFEEVEDDDSQGLATEAWQQYIAETADACPKSLAEIEELGLSPEDLRETYDQLSIYPDVDFPTPETSAPDCEPVLEQLRDFVDRAFPSIPDKPVNDKGFDALQTQVRNAKRVFGRIPTGTAIRVSEGFRILSEFEGGLDVTLNRWKDKNEAKRYRDEYEDTIQPLVDGICAQWYAHRYPFAIRFAKQAADHYAAFRKQRGVMNFTDLLQSTSAMLRKDATVREYFSRQFRQILVDEFQDTDPIQAEILLWLTGEESAEKTGLWQNRLPRPGSLFVVGDPKQAIYRFRRADIQTFELVRNIILKSNGKVAKLTTSFRASAGLTTPLNLLLEPLFQGASAPYQAEFQPLVHKQDNPGFPSSGIRALVVVNADGKVATVVNDDSKRVADAIEWAVAGNVKTSEKGIERTVSYGDIMILLPRKKNLADYCQALEESGIPYAVKGAESFSKSAELQEISRLFSLLADTSNQVELFRVLRGSIFGKSDKTILEFVSGGGDLSVSPKTAGTNAAAAAEIMPTLERLKNWWSTLLSTAPAVAFEQIINESGITQFGLTGKSGGSAAGNILKAIELVRVSDPVTPHALVECLRKMLESDTEEHAIPQTDDGLVQIMNFHQCKGLEAKVVFLAAPLMEKKHTPAHHIERGKNDTPTGYICVQKPNGEFAKTPLAHHPDWDQYCQTETSYLDAEKKRIQYVAATRAAELLVVSVSKVDKKELTAGYWSPLVPNPSVIPALDVPYREQKAEPEMSIDASKCKEEVQVALVGIDESSTPSFAQTAAKDFAIAGNPYPDSDAANGHGKKFGTIVHSILECHPIPDPLEPYATMLVVQHGLEEARTADVVAAVGRVTASDLWKRADKSSKVLREVPFVVPITDAGKTIPTITSGAIDLMFWEDDGWVIVDYKTDAGAIGPLVEHYKPQLDLYASVWTTNTSQPVKEKWLLFAASGEAKRV